jgi:hypothetical protein
MKSRARCAAFKVGFATVQMTKLNRKARQGREENL